MPYKVKTYTTVAQDSFRVDEKKTRSLGKDYGRTITTNPDGSVHDTLYHTWRRGSLKFGNSVLSERATDNADYNKIKKQVEKRITPKK